MDYQFYQKLFNQQIDSLLGSSGLSTECTLNYGVKNLAECPNCIYDGILKKSANIYKIGGPISFSDNQICPYCRGSGIYGSAQTENVFMAILWDYKSWIIKPINLENPTGYIQTICSKDYTKKILQAQDMTVQNVQSPDKPTFILDGEPTPAGLGDQNYIITQWKKARK